MTRFVWIFIALNANTSYGQYSFRSAGSNSGIIVGTNNASRFAGINYDLSSLKLGLAIRQTSQNLSDSRSSNTNQYPDLVGQNFYVGIGISSGKSTLIKNNTWQGAVETAYDLSHTRDRTPIDFTNNSIRSKKTKRYFSQFDDNKQQFSTRSECEQRFGSPCDTIITIVEYYDLQAYEGRSTLIDQRTWFLRLSGAVGRQNLAITPVANKNDSLQLTSELFTIPRLAIGYNRLKRFRQLRKITFTGAASLSYFFIPKSTAILTEYTFQSVVGQYNNGKIIQLSDSKSYFKGVSEYEGICNPRLDIVANIMLGEKKPYVNLIGAYSPSYSTLSTIGWKQNYAAGFGLSLPTLPDQMLFAILYEGLSTNTNKQVKALTFYATVPFSFK